MSNGTGFFLGGGGKLRYEGPKEVTHKKYALPHS